MPTHYIGFQNASALSSALPALGAAQPHLHQSSGTNKNAEPEWFDAFVQYLVLTSPSPSLPSSAPPSAVSSSLKCAVWLRHLSDVGRADRACRYRRGPACGLFCHFHLPEQQ